MFGFKSAVPFWGFKSAICLSVRPSARPSVRMSVAHSRHTGPSSVFDSSFLALSLRLEPVLRSDL